MLTVQFHNCVLLIFLIIIAFDLDHLCFDDRLPRCHAACEEWEEVVSLLAPPQEPLPDQVPPDTPSPQAKGNTSVLTLPSLGNIEASAHVLRGQAQGALGDLHSSLESYRQALTADVFCEEALERLCAQNCLTPEEEKSLMDALPFKTQCTPLEEKTLR